MKSSTAFARFFCLVAVCCAAQAHANTPTPAPRPLLSTAVHAVVQRPDPRDDLARAAFAQIANNQPYNTASMAQHPLAGWVEMASLQARINQLSNSEGDGFLRRHQGQPVGENWRTLWLTELARRQDWSSFLHNWDDAINNTALRCSALYARALQHPSDRNWQTQALNLWRESGKALPSACNNVFDTLASRGLLDEAAIWARIDTIANAGEADLLLQVSRRLPQSQATLARDYAAFIQAPHSRAQQWPRNARSAQIAAAGLAKLARSNPDAAETQLAQLATVLPMTAAIQAPVRYQIALWTVASLDRNGAQRMAAVPADSYDSALHEWRVRDALARQDWRGVQQAIALMPTEQRESARWSWFNARAHEALGHTAQAQHLYRHAAQFPEFHGFLAADKLNQPYPLCPLQPTPSHSAQAQVAQDAGLQRALMLQRIGQRSWAVREWNAAAQRFSAEQRHIAVAIAQAQGWFDRGLFGLVNVNGQRLQDELRLYTLRFPLHHQHVIRREAARHQLDAAWVAGQTRAESMFDTNARSSADARGLMQILPRTGQDVARRLGLPWQGADSLYQAETNLTLGTAYLGQLLQRYPARVDMVIAAYNAGPAPVTRWQQARGHMPSDIWIETMTYRETREYVARVLAFSAIYDWQLDGQARRVSDRIRGITNGARTPFVCPTSTAQAR